MKKQILFVLLMMIVAGAGFFVGKSSKTLEPKLASQETSGSKSVVWVSVPVPGSKEWVRYFPKCVALSRSVEIFYPSKWGYKEESGWPDDDSCIAMFGWPEPLGGSQSPGMEVTSLRITTFVNGRSLEEFEKSRLDQPEKYRPVTSWTEINGRKFLKESFKDTDFYFLSTKVGKRFFVFGVEGKSVNTPILKGENVSFLFADDVQHFVSEEFVKRIKFFE